VARLNDVHAFGYNSAGSKRIWMKFGELRVYCLEHCEEGLLTWVTIVSCWVLLKIETSLWDSEIDMNVV